jgi:N-acetylmuramoyl-L-alanine amidase
MRRLAWGLVLALLIVVLALPSGLAARSTGHPRHHVIDALIIHSLGGPDCQHGTRFFKQIGGDAQSWAHAFESLPGVSIHYVIGRDGAIVVGVPEAMAASQAIGWNQRSIGIELVNNGDGVDPFPAAQLDALVQLAREIRQRHPAITLEHVLRHSDVDQTTFAAGLHGRACSAYRRKLDPGDAFPWADFKAALARNE